MLRKLIAGCALAALMVSPAVGQTVDEIIAKNIEAKGGMEKMKAVKTTRATGKMIMGQGMEAPFIMMQKRPSSTRMEFTFQGMTGIQAYDGTNAWMVMPFMGKKDPEAMAAEETKMIAEQADMDGPLVDYKTKGHKVELIGKEQVEGADAYKLKVTMKDGNLRYYYLDAETYLEIKSEGKRKVRGTEVEGETLYGDYKAVGGMMIAHTMDSGAKGMPQRQKMVLEKIEINPTLADTLFLMPPGTKPAAVDTSKAAATKAAEGAKATGEAAAGTATGTATTQAGKAKAAPTTPAKPK